MLNRLYYYKKFVKVFIFFILGVFAVILLNNRLQNNITNMHVDEIHTIIFGIKSMHDGKLGTDPGELMVGESSRWLARIIYPLANYYMHTKRGGIITSTADIDISKNYIKNNLLNTSSLIDDPNIQDFIFMMKFILGFLVILSFLLASYIMSKYYGIVSGIAYFSFSLSTALIDEMLLVFYTESTLIILFNLIIIIGLINHINKLRLYIWLSFILAFAVSTKLTGILFLLPIATILFIKNNYKFINLHIDIFILLTFIFTILIHVFALGNLMEVLNETLVNVYHFKTGHGGISIPSGFYQLKLIIKDLTPWIFLLPLSILILLNKKVIFNIFIWMIVLTLTIMLLSLVVDVHFYNYRNLTTPLVMIIFIISISLTSVKFRDREKQKFIILLFTIIIIINYLFLFYKKYITMDDKLISKYSKECKNIALIDLDSKLFDNSTSMNSMPEEFNINIVYEKLREQFDLYDCVIVKRINNNKHYTNFILPKDHKIFKRVGDYFIYKKTTDVLTISKMKEGILALNKKNLFRESKFNIYLDNNILYLYKLSCYDVDIKNDFVVKTKPINNTNNNFDSTVYNAINNNKIIKHTCYIEIPLPNYDYGEVTIGQYENGNIIWEETIINKEGK